MWGIRGIQEHLHGWGHHDPRDRRWGQCGIRGCEDSARAGHRTSGTPRLSCPLSCDPTSPVSLQFRACIMETVCGRPMSDDSEVSSSAQRTEVSSVSSSQVSPS